VHALCQHAADALDVVVPNMPGYVCSDRPTGPVLNSIDVARLWAELMGEPDAGRHMPSWARQAGFEKIESSASAWCYAGPQDRPWWGASWAERLTESPFGDRAVEHGLATRADLERLAEGWRRWAASEDGWFCIPHGEILCQVPA
jgi:hypothetical protein